MDPSRKYTQAVPASPRQPFPSVGLVNGRNASVRTNGVAAERLDVEDAAIGRAPHGRGARGSVPRLAGQSAGRSRLEATARRGVDVGLDVRQRARGGWAVKQL
jgi:hypothetical protein